MRPLVLCEGAAEIVVAVEVLLEGQVIYLDNVWAAGGVLDELCVLRVIGRRPWAPS